jgi:hypothetical protein
MVRTVLAFFWVFQAACIFPGDPAKTLVVTNQCKETVWLRVSDIGQADPTTMAAVSPRSMDPNGSPLSYNIFDNGPDGMAVAVSTVPDQIGQVVHVPHTEGDTVSFVVTPDLCP